jgi:hypothetical protein
VAWSNYKLLKRDKFKRGFTAICPLAKRCMQIIRILSMDIILRIKF